MALSGVYVTEICYTHLTQFDPYKKERQSNEPLNLKQEQNT